MSEYTDNYRFYLTSPTPRGRRLVDEVEDFDIDQVRYQRNEVGRYFQVSREEKLTFVGSGYDYLSYIDENYGPDTFVELQVERKRRDVMTEDWTVLYTAQLDLYSLEFDEEVDIRTALVEVFTSELLTDIEARWEDEYDITADTEKLRLDSGGIDDFPTWDTSDLPFKTLKLEAREIFRRTLWRPFNPRAVGDEKYRVSPIPDFNIREPIFLNLDDEITGDPQATSQIFSGPANRSNMLYFNDSGDVRNVDLFWRLGYEVIAGGIGIHEIYYVVYREEPNGTYTNIEEGPLQPNQPLNNIPGENTYTDGDTPLENTLREGSPLNIEIPDGHGLSIVVAASGAAFTIQFSKPEDGRPENFVLLQENQSFRPTFARVLRYRDLMQKLMSLQGYDFDSKIFEDDGAYGDLFVAHGTWIRNMPQIINDDEELDDKRRVQSNISMEFAYEAIEIKEPMAYDDRGGKFFMQRELDTQQNFITLSLRDREGDLMECADKQRFILSENHYGLCEIGSQQSGQNYGEERNIFSNCGKAQYQTGLKKAKQRYEVLSDVRTGSEDWELARQLQWTINSEDSIYDNDWFFVFAKPDPSREDCFVPKRWRDVFGDDDAKRPINTLSVETDYNWGFVPSELLRGHAWKIKAGLIPVENQDPTTPIEFLSSTCNSSLITFPDDRGAWPEDVGQPLDRFARAPFRAVAYQFEVVLSYEQVEALTGNKYGVIEFQWNGVRRVGRLITGGANGQFQLVEAR